MSHTTNFSAELSLGFTWLTCKPVPPSSKFVMEGSSAKPVRFILAVHCHENWFPLHRCASRWSFLEPKATAALVTVKINQTDKAGTNTQRLLEEHKGSCYRAALPFCRQQRAVFIPSPSRLKDFASPLCQVVSRLCIENITTMTTTSLLLLLVVLLVRLVLLVLPV